MTGLEWIRESGLLTSIVALTNTHSVGVVRDALIGWEAQQCVDMELFGSLPVVAETWDGILNDLSGQHVRGEHLLAAINGAVSGPVPEGNVGSGTGMICHGFKGGIGTSSRVVSINGLDFTVGVLVQANHGARRRLSILGRPVGELISQRQHPLPSSKVAEGAGSIIGIVATDAPMIPTQLSGLAQRVGLGVARTGGLGEHTSGDLFLAFSTANRSLPPSNLSAGNQTITSLTMLSHSSLDSFYEAVVEATEESIVNAMVAADTMVGRDGNTAVELPHEFLKELFNTHGHGQPQVPRA
jgi:D-aminopeptidase